MKILLIAILKKLNSEPPTFDSRAGSRPRFQAFSLGGQPPGPEKIVPQDSPAKEETVDYAAVLEFIKIPPG